jgi:hypothetical protein
MKSVPGASLQAGEQAIRSRFERAESILSKHKKSVVKQGHRLQSKGDKVIRDSFTIPTDEYPLISQIKKRCMKSGFGPNKSEVLRAGLAALRDMPDSELAEVFEGLKKVKTGRPTARK